MTRLLDTEQLAELKFVLEDDFPSFIDSFVADTEIKLAQLQALLANESVRACRDIAHSLKGSCLNSGATKMAEQCQHLQLADSDINGGAHWLALQSTWAETKAELQKI